MAKRQGTVVWLVFWISLTWAECVLQKFNEIINKSRSEAERAEENVQEIERLISSANNKSDEATVILGLARKSAQNAMAVAEEAEKAAGRAKEVGSAGWENDVSFFK